MRDRFIPAFIMLVAGAITCIFDIYHKTELLTSLKKLFLVLVIFYIIGLIAKTIVIKALTPKPKANKDESEDNLENESEDSNEDSSESKTVGNAESKDADKSKEVDKSKEADTQ